MSFNFFEFLGKYLTNITLVYDVKVILNTVSKFLIKSVQNQLLFWHDKVFNKLFDGRFKSWVQNCLNNKNFSKRLNIEIIFGWFCSK